LDTISAVGGSLAIIVTIAGIDELAGRVSG
jgi:hypothetical protein